MPSHAAEARVAGRRSAREAAKQETRLALVEAARDEFAEKGFDAPSLDAICARAGYTRGAFYVHFKSRDELLVAVMEHTLGLVLDALMGVDEEPETIETTVARYASLASQGVENLAKRPRTEPATAGIVPFFQILAACDRSERIRKKLVATLREASRRLAERIVDEQSAHRVRADVGAEELASLLLMMALGMRVSADLRVPIEVAPARDALLRMLAPA